MKTLTVLFIGLMIHVNQPSSLDNTVVIPYVPHHRAELRIPKQAVRNPDDAFVKNNFKLVDGFYCLTLDKQKFRIEGTRGIFSDKRPTFFAAAPPLKTLAPTCELRKEVRDRTLIANDLIAFIDYRGGRVTPESYFLKMLNVLESNWKGEHCTTCTARYEADLDGDEARLVFPNGTVRLAGNSQIDVRNLPVEDVDGSHFDYHFKIFKEDAKCKPPKIEFGNPCLQTPLCDPSELMASGCAISQVAQDPDTDPPPFPDADCTNSHYP